MKKPKLHDAEAVERLRQAILATEPFQAHLRPEPDWSAKVAPLGLPSNEAVGLVTNLKRLWLLPFADVAALADLLVFQHTRLASHENQARAGGDLVRARLCVLFRFLVEMALQGNSVFPQNPTHLARQVQLALEPGLSRPEYLEPLLELLVDGATLQPRSGFNAQEPADPELIILGEHERREGIAEGLWKARHKFDDYKAGVLAHTEFHADWQAIQKRFNVAQFRDSRGLIRRSRLPERNWQQPQHPNLRVTAERFQVVFDFFCWKWFLYGMKEDKPMVEKLTVTLTPFGTQIFIPGYWSFDAARDLDWRKVLELHRARGVERQGKKLASNREHLAIQLARLRQANKEAKRRKLQGEARYAFLKLQAGLSSRTDDAQVRRMLRRDFAAPRASG